MTRIPCRDSVAYPRVVHVSSALDPGGIETWLSRLIQIPEGERLVGGVVVLSAREGLLAPRFQERGIPVYCLPVSSNPLGFVLAMRRILTETGPWDIVHSHVHRRSALVHLGALLAGVRVRISHSHNTKGQEAATGSPLHWACKSIATAVLNRLSHTRLACSQAAAEALYTVGEYRQPNGSARGCTADRRRATMPGVHCIPYGMDLDVFQSQAAIPVTRESLGIPSGAKVVGHVGRFMEQKNHRFLLEVAARALALCPGLHFLLVGDGPLRPEMQALAARLGISDRVTFTGNRLDVPALMSQCMDCFFFPSLWEGLGIVLLEAQAAGLPCVFSDAVPPEANRVPGANRVFSLASSPDSVASVLVQVIQEAPHRVGKKPALKDILYSLSGNAETLARIYRESLALSAGKAADPQGYTVWSNQ